MEKDRVLLECLVQPKVTSNAISNGEQILAESVKNNMHDISDMIRDNKKR